MQAPTDVKFLVGMWLVGALFIAALELIPTSIQEKILEACESQGGVEQVLVYDKTHMKYKCYEESSWHEIKKQ